jgi:calcium binding protein 39
MSFLFKSKPKSPIELVKLTREGIHKLDASSGESKKVFLLVFYILWSNLIS